MSANWVDLAIALVILVSFVTSLRRGLIREGLGVGSLLAGTILAGRFHPMVAAVLSPLRASPELTGLVSFGLILVTTMVVAGLVGGMIYPIGRIPVLGCADRLGGGALGILEGVLLAELLVALGARFGPGELQVSLAHSQVATYLLSQWVSLLSLLPPDFQAVRAIFETPLSRPGG